MKDAILIINAGSSSIKFAIYCHDNSKDNLDILYRGEIDGIGQQGCFRIYAPPQSLATNDTLLVEKIISIKNHDDALLTLLNWIDECANASSIVAVGHRIVHGGVHYSGPVIVDTKVEARLEELVPLAPLHQPHHLAAIRALRRLKPDVLQVACFDTAFHRSMPLLEQLFAIPRSFFDAGVLRYGFHGLSYEYIARVLPDYLTERTQGRIIVAHLGHGASLCAMKEGKSIATTMSFTPLDGLPMATRSGSVDPAVVLYLQREKGMTNKEVSDLLHYQSGLLGVSGISGDIRELLASDDPAAAEAIDLFVYRVNRELGSLVATLGGLDALVFTAGIGEHAPDIRERICRHATWLDIRLNTAANLQNERQISASDSVVLVWVIPTNEELIIAEHTVRAMNKKYAL